MNSTKTIRRFHSPKVLAIQDKILHLFKDHQYIITLKSRQLGLSTLASAYSLWLMIFHKDKNILALATTQATARNLVTKTIFMYDQLQRINGKT